MFDILGLDLGHAVEPERGLDARAPAFGIFPAETIEQDGEAPLFGQPNEIFEAADGILQPRREDFEILRVSRFQHKTSAHSAIRVMSAPTLLNFSSSRSKPRSR